jgi:formylglycine-generating enzyme
VRSALQLASLVVVAGSLLAFGGTREARQRGPASGEVDGDGVVDPRAGDALGGPTTKSGDADDARDQGNEGDDDGEGDGDEAATDGDGEDVAASDEDDGTLAEGPDGGKRKRPHGGCPSTMVRAGNFCIDRYEAPNEKGQKPLAFRTAIDGETWCAAHGKRLCTEAEWVRACEGAAARPYPYGTTYVKSTCNDDKTWISPNWTTLGTYPSDASVAEATRLYQADPSGARAGCLSEDGVMDLTGNVAEWVVRSFPHPNDYAHVMKGCYWSGCYGGSPPSCAFVNPAHPGTFRTYKAGFRCCLGGTTDGG